MSDTLFGCIPDSIFRVFVGRYARAAEMVLTRLRSSFFGDFASETPEREAVKASISAALVGYVAPPPEDGTEGEPGELSTEYLYARLREAGWLTEDVDRWRTWVDMPMACRRLLALLELLREETARSFTGLVSEVSTLVDAAAGDPARYGTNIDGAYRTATAFRQRMSEIDSGVASFARRLAASEHMDDAVAIFFSDFVERRIADWSGEMTRNNPWRSRAAIVAAARRIRRDRSILDGVARAYVEARHAADLEEAETVVASRLSDIETCFDDIERLRLRIEERHRSVEGRLGSILRYIGRNPGLSRQRIRDALAALGALPDEAELLCPFLLLHSIEPFGEAVMADAREVVSVPVRRTLTRRQADPLDHAYLAACRAFDRVCDPGRRRVAEWVASADARADLSPANTAEWFMWRKASLLAQRGLHLPDGRRLVRSDTRAECRYGTTAGFVLDKEK